MACNRGPIERVSSHWVLQRVGFKLIELDWRRNPQPYLHHAPGAVLALAERLRGAGFGNMYWTLLAASKVLAKRWKLVEWRDMGPDETSRALHKQRVRWRR